MNKPFITGKVLLGTTLTAALLFSGCGSSENFVFTNTNNVAAPIAVDDAFNALGNATVNQAATGVLTNDQTNGGAITAFDAVGSQGGTIDLKTDGSFSYTPILGFVGAETFAYTLSSGAGTSTATVTMTSTGLGQFVDNTAAPGGNGSQAAPFDTLQEAIDASTSGDTIFVARGNGTNTGQQGGFILPDGVELIGEGSGLILAQTIIPPGLAPMVEGPITCLGNNTVSGLDIDGSVSDGIIVNGAGNVTISDNTIGNPTQEHIDCDNVSGTLSITGNTFDTPPNTNQDFLGFENLNTNATITMNNNTFVNAANNDVRKLARFAAVGTSALDLTFHGNQAVGAVANQFEDGLDFLNGGSGACTASIDGNKMENLEGFGIYLGRSSGIVSSNTLTTIGKSAILAQNDTGTLTISGNVISEPFEGINLFAPEGDGLYVVSNNNVSDSGDNAVFYNAVANADGKLAVRNNVFTNGAIDAVLVQISGNSSVCCDITDNTVNTDMKFTDISTGDITVERFGDASGDELKTVNTFTAPATVTVTNDAVVDAIPGFCAIP
jgi:Bacterial Ig domain